MITQHPTLLVVDDEPHVLAALRRSLRRESFRVITTGTPEEALEIACSEAVAAVLSDHKMPTMNGDELLALVAQRLPSAALFLLTGWPEAVAPERLASIGVRAVIPKPWDDAELKRVLGGALTLRTPPLAGTSQRRCSTP